MTGAEVVGSETLDTVTFKVLDTPAGTYSGVANKVLSQFATTQNVVKDVYQYSSIYDADLYIGLRVVVEYTSLSDKTVGINLFLNEVVAA
jgi:septum formation inhibitor-activating ATPase MinD